MQSPQKPTGPTSGGFIEKLRQLWAKITHRA